MSLEHLTVYTVDHAWNRAHTGVAWDVVIVDHEPQSQQEWDYLTDQVFCRMNPGAVLMLVEPDPDPLKDAYLCSRSNKPPTDEDLAIVAEFAEFLRTQPAAPTEGATP